jgi:DNA sulfur modification protein DndB
MTILIARCVMRGSWEGLVDKEEIRSLSKSKRDAYRRESVDRGKENYYLERGWILDKELKTKIKLSKPKLFDERFEDYVWYVLSGMNFDQMNSDRNFRIPIGNSVNPAQVDVFTIDENVALVIECKSSEKLIKKSLRDDISKLVGLKGSIIKSVISKFSRDIRVGFILATENIALNDLDLKYARENGISCINENDLEYYLALQENIKDSAKYQFLSDVFEERDIPGLSLKIPAIRGNMGGDTFYSFVIEPSKLLPIAYISHRARNNKNDDATYQRIIKKNRLQQIREYVENEQGLFPNSIILNIHSGKKKMQFDYASKDNLDSSAVLGYLTLPKRYKSAWVIDGQHRLYGFTNTSVADKVTIPVIAFENLDGSKEVNMFVDINSKQVKVSRNHLELLHADIHWNSPRISERLQALRSKVVLDLADERTSPFFDRIKTLDAGEGITISSFTVPLGKTGLFGKVNVGGGFIPGPLYDPRTSSDSINMTNSRKRGFKILFDYFSALSDAENWRLSSKDGGYLCTGDAIQSEIILLSAIIKHIGNKVDAIELETDDLSKQIVNYVSHIVDYFNAAPLEQIKDFKSKRGAQGHSLCAYEMMNMIYKNDSSFKPEGLEKHLRDKEAKWNDKATNLVYEVQKMISDDVISTLKKEFGDSEDGWWKMGVPTELRKKIAVSREEEKVSKDFEEYFVLIDYEKIITKNWKLFENKYAFTKGGKRDEQLKWYYELNKLRNKIAHPERGVADEEDFNFIEGVVEELRLRLNKTK